MNERGKVYIADEEKLARFINALIASGTAIFHVIPKGNGYEVTFEGGY